MGKFGEIDSAETRAEKFPLVSMGGWAEGPACTDTGARTPIGASGINKSAQKGEKFSKNKADTVLPDTL